MSEPTSEQEIESLRAELQASRAALGHFAYAVSHDLRAPLRHITAYSQLLQEELGERLDGEPAQFLATITHAAQLMGRQIDGLRAWAQLDGVALQWQPVDTAALLAELRQSLPAERALGTAHTVEWQMAVALPRLQGDGMLLRQLFGHLLSNALKFTGPRAVGQIEIGVQASPAGWATLTVRDNGVGYNPAQQDKLFHVFQRLHSASQFEGLGLGLALAQKIVQRHGGMIRIEGALDAGCCVTLTLPAA